MNPLSNKTLLWAAAVLLAGCSSVSVRNPAHVGTSTGAGWRAYIPLRLCSLPCRPTAELLQEAMQRANDDPQRAITEEVVAVGYASVAAQPSGDPAQQRLMAARASRLDAYRNLYEQVYGLNIGSNTAMDDNKVRRESIRASSTGKLKGVEIVSIEPLGTDTYQTTLRLPAIKQ